MRQREFEQRYEAEEFLTKLKRNKVSEYEFTRHRFKTKLDKAKETNIRWLGVEIPLWSLSFPIVLILLGIVAKVLS